MKAFHCRLAPYCLDVNDPLPQNSKKKQVWQHINRLPAHISSVYTYRRIPFLLLWFRCCHQHHRYDMYTYMHMCRICWWWRTHLPTRWARVHSNGNQITGCATDHRPTYITRDSSVTPLASSHLAQNTHTHTCVANKSSILTNSCARTGFRWGATTSAHLR